jgi:superoxide dismutase, Fe-Mn family
MNYSVKQNIKPSNLNGISNDQLDDHWKLYEGYVAQVGKLAEELNSMRENGEQASLAYSDRRRRYGFEYNGMVLHEFYFENLRADSPTLEQESPLYIEIEKSFGSFEAWKTDFAQTGKTRGIGWAILYADPVTKMLTNNFVEEHSHGNIAGFKPIIVMDVWEHAYMVDHKAGGRATYIDAFVSNINWQIVSDRFNSL